MDDQYFNAKTQLYEYPVVDPKTGAQAILPAKTPKTAEHIAEKGYRLLTPPNPNPNAPVEGAATSSPVVEQGKAAASFAIGLIAPALGAGAGSQLAPPALKAVGRVVGAVSGGVLGKAASTGVLEQRMITTPEMLLEAGSAAIGELANTAILKDPSEAEQIGAALRKMAGVGDPMTKIGRRVTTAGRESVRATGDVASDIAASRSILGRDILTAVPTVAKGINKHESRLFKTVELEADKAKVRVRIPGDAQQEAAAASADIGDPRDHPDIASARKMKGILDRIASFGQTPQGVQDLSVREFRKLQREIGRLAPGFKNRLMPGDEDKGLLVSLQGKLTDELKRAVKGTPAEEALNEANRYHQEVKVQFRDNIVDTMKGVKEGSYADVMDLLVIADKPDKLRIAMQDFSPELQQKLRQSWLNNHVIVKASDASGAFDVNTALKELDKLSPETANALFQGEYGNVQKIMARAQQEVNISKGILGTQEKALVKRAVPFAASAGLWGLWKGDFLSATQALGLGGGALFLSYLLSQPRAVRFFARGLEAPNNSRLAIRYGTQIMSHMPVEILKALKQEPPAPGSQEDISQISQRHAARVAAGGGQ